MKILQLCNKPPYPPVDGGTLGMHRCTEGFLSAGCDVKVLTVCTDKHPVPANMDDEYRQCTRFESVYIDLEPHVIGAGVALLCGESYNVKRYESRSFEQKLVTILDNEEFDIIQVESIFLTPYIPAIRNHSQARVVLRAPNVENQIWHQRALHEHNLIRRWYLKKLALALRMYEVEHINDYDAVICISPIDSQFFKDNGCRRRQIVIPFGINNPQRIDNTTSDSTALFHLGSMDWEPNVEAITWLLDKIWPRIQQRCPQAHLYLAGHQMPQSLLNRHIEGVSIEGEVTDAMDFMRDKQLSVIPLLSGSGIRVKIIEAMSLGKTVISTTIGASGIAYTPGHNILIADDATTFADAVCRCIEQPQWARQIGDNAFHLIQEEYDNKKLINKLIAFYNSFLDTRD